MKYVAFLRGVNIGRTKQVKMSLLKETLVSQGYTNVTTLLNSGNVVFETNKKATSELQRAIENTLKITFGFDIPTIMRTSEQIKQLITSEPFSDISLTAQTRLYVTFLSRPVQSTISLPYTSETGDLRILSGNDTEVCSVVRVSTSKNTTDLMSRIEKEWGKDVTTRNWNTLLKIGNLL